MTRIIDASRKISINYPRFVRIRKSGKPMEVFFAETDETRNDPTRKIWIRFVSFVQEALPDLALISFDGYLSESYSALAERTFDKIDSTMAQYVRGSILPPFGTGTISPWVEGTGDSAPGAEPFVIIHGETGVRQVLGHVLARSAQEAATRCGFVKTRHDWEGYPVYRGKISADGELTRIQLIPLRDLPKFPLH